MHSEITTFLLSEFRNSVVGVFMVSSQLLYTWYKKDINRINEVYFVMGNSSPCCNLFAETSKIKECTTKYCNAKLLMKVVDHINEAKHTICIAMYLLTVRRISDAIVAAKRRGVIVRIVCDYSMDEDGDNSQIGRLKTQGISVRIAGDEKKTTTMHNKFCLIDVLVNKNSFEHNKHPVNGILINGSMNWTLTAFDRNWENICFTSDEHLKTEFKNAFDYIWDQIGPS